MTIMNPDGTVYNVTGSLQQFDPENPDLKLLDLWDQEAIALGGSPILYYECIIQLATYDKLYVEDRGKLWCNTPVQMFVVYEPVPCTNTGTYFGYEGNIDMIFSANYHDTINKIGHLPKIGSRIYTPHKQENWVVIQNNLDQYNLWGQLRVQIVCNRYRENLSTGEHETSIQPEQDFKL